MPVFTVSPPLWCPRPGVLWHLWHDSWHLWQLCAKHSHSDHQVHLGWQIMDRHNGARAAPAAMLQGDAVLADAPWDRVEYETAERLTNP